MTIREKTKFIEGAVVWVIGKGKNYIRLRPTFAISISYKRHRMTWSRAEGLRLTSRDRD